MTAPTRQKAEFGGLLSLPRVNLIPQEISQRRRLRTVQAGLGGTALAAVAVIVLLYVLASASVSSANNDLTSAKAAHASVQKQVDGYQHVSQTYALVDQAHGLLRDAGGNEVRWSSYLADLSLRIPETVWLTKITVAAAPAAPAGAAPGAAAVAQISFEGVALSHDDVANWLDSVAKEHGWSDASFSRSEEKFIGSHQTYSFTSTVTVTAAALSGRYTNPAGS